MHGRIVIKLYIHGMRHQSDLPASVISPLNCEDWLTLDSVRKTFRQRSSSETTEDGAQRTRTNTPFRKVALKHGRLKLRKKMG